MASAMCQQVINLRCFNVLRWIFPDSQCLEMYFAAFYFRTFLVAEVVGEEAAFRLNHEVTPLDSILLHQHGPVRVVGAEGRRHAEPAREFGVNLDRLVLLQLLGKGTLGVGLVDDLLMDRLVHVDHGLEVARQLFGLEQLLGVVFLGSDALVFDAVHEGHALGAVDDLGGEFDELLRVSLEIIEPAAVHEDAVDAAASELSLVLEVGEDVGQLDVPFIEGHRGGGGRFLHLRQLGGEGR